MIADQTYHLTAEGHVVHELDPNGRTLLVAKGCEIDDDLAAHYGLPVVFTEKLETQSELELQAEPQPASEKAARPSANKALRTKDTK